MDNTKKTQEETIIEVISDFSVLKNKIENNTALLSDYIKFQELMNILGLDEDFVLKSLKEHGFPDWKSYIEERKNENSYNTVKIGSVVGSLIGMINAVTNFLKKSVQK